MISNAWKHGEKEDRKVTPEYRAWQQAKERCYNPNNPAFVNYGDRGIRMCEQWLNSVETFIRDMGRKPTSKHTLDRIDNNGNYEPSNCRWATRTQQSRNRRGNKLTMVEAREIRMLFDRGYSCRDLAREFGCGKSTISYIVNEDTWKEGYE